MKIAAYQGWLGKNNIGDEAIYMATNKLLNEFELVYHEALSECDLLVYGGGTLLPKHLTNDTHNCDLKIAIGVGASDPEFWNQPFGTLDLSYYLGKLGYSYLLQNKLINRILKPTQTYFESLNTSHHYLNDEAYRQVREVDFDHLGVRGPNTKQLLTEYGMESEVVGDTALILEPRKYRYSPQKRIAITLREGLYQWSREGRYIDEILEFCETLSDSYEFVFLPFSPSDIGLNVKAAKSISHATFRDYCSCVNVGATINEIAQCDLVIADKLHANVLAAAAHTPFISLEYRPKNLDFAKSIGMAQYNLRSDKVNEEDIEELADIALNNEELKQHLINQVNEKRANLSEFAREIRDEL